MIDHSVAAVVVTMTVSILFAEIAPDEEVPVVMIDVTLGDCDWCHQVTVLWGCRTPDVSEYIFYLLFCYISVSIWLFILYN